MFQLFSTNINTWTHNNLDYLVDINTYKSYFHWASGYNSSLHYKTNMEFNPNMEIHGHVVVYLEHYIVVFGGKGKDFQPLSKCIIWMYNLYTEKWRKEEIESSTEAPPSCYEASAVAIQSDIYMFDGRKGSTCSPMDTLWKLTRNLEGIFFWSRIIIADTVKVPPYHWDHSGWEFEGKMWIFGGKTMSEEKGASMFNVYCNQLLCFIARCRSFGFEAAKFRIGLIIIILCFAWWCEP